MAKIILVAGATGKLGRKIVTELIMRYAQVRVIVRNNSKQEVVEGLKKLGAEVITAEYNQPAELIEACSAADCVVSALAGLRPVIVDAQSKLLEAALAAGVPRFIPSDFSCDFTRLPGGENRNFDLRKEFHKRLDNAPIDVTSIFNGAFTDILSYNTPFYDTKNKTIAYWGRNANWQVDFTTMDNTAAYTAAAALDGNAPRALHIASFRLSAKDLLVQAEKIEQEKYTMQPMGSLADFAEYNRQARAADPNGENELYPKWQSSQYLHSMFSVHNETLDNDRYKGISWTSASEVLERIHLQNHAGMAL